MANGSRIIAAASSGVIDSLTIDQQLELIYIAYFNRAADGGGDAFWSEQNVQAQNRGQGASVALTNIANSFAPQAETVALYPFLGTPNIDLSTPAARAGLGGFIDGVFGNLFGHAPDAAGKAYWVGQITSGAVGLGAAALAIANGATGGDAIEVQNKIAVALDFTTRTTASGLGKSFPLPAPLVTAARNVLSGVDGMALNDATVTAGMNATSAYIATAAPTIGGVIAIQAITDRGFDFPFANVTIAEPNAGQIETVTVTLSARANGRLFPFNGGSYDATAGVFAVAGDAASVTAALRRLDFTPTVNQVGTGQTVTTTFTIAVTDTAGASATDSNTAVVALAASPVGSSLASLQSQPVSGLIADAAGNLFGAISAGSTQDLGAVFEVAHTAGGFASAPVTVASFKAADGLGPTGGLTIDAAGNLFGETTSGGLKTSGTVFEIIHTGTGYSNTPVTLASFDAAIAGTPDGGLIVDPAGNLFGTTASAGSPAGGTVFEIVHTGTGFASAPITLASFNAAGVSPVGGVIADAASNLFGTTTDTNGGGTVFEIVHGATGYAATPTTLASFTVANGGGPRPGLTIDATGNLYGTTASTVFEIAHTATGYASVPTTLGNFVSLGPGVKPDGKLIIDAAGDLFGTAANAGPSNGNVVFELLRTATGYLSAPIILDTFQDVTNPVPRPGLIADAAGNLYGATFGGVVHLPSSGVTLNGNQVFQVSGAGFQVAQRGIVVSTHAQAGASSQAEEIGAATTGAADPAVITVTSQDQLADPALAAGTMRFLGGSGADAVAKQVSGVDQISGFEFGDGVPGDGSLFLDTNDRLSNDLAPAVMSSIFAPESLGISPLLDHEGGFAPP